MNNNNDKMIEKRFEAVETLVYLIKGLKEKSLLSGNLHTRKISTYQIDIFMLSKFKLDIDFETGKAIIIIRAKTKELKEIIDILLESSGINANFNLEKIDGERLNLYFYELIERYRILRHTPDEFFEYVESFGDFKFSESEKNILRHKFKFFIENN